MHFWLNFLLLAGSLPSACLGQHSKTDIPAGSPLNVAANVPPCAVTCLTTILSKSTCPLTDLQCVCNNEPIKTEINKCVLTSCSLTESLATKNATSTACHAPIRDKSMQNSVMSISLGVTAILIVVARIIFKKFFSATQEFGPDDKVIIVILLLRIVVTIFSVQGLDAHGLGRDTWTLDQKQLASFVGYLFGMELFYIAELSLIKLSLSLFYLHIFTGLTIRRLLWGTVIFNAVFGITFFIAAIFQCTPVNYYWTQYLEHSEGQCVNINLIGWTNAAINVAVDIWMIALPLSQVRLLKLHWKKKALGVVIMFLTGTFVTIVSILRLQFMIYFDNSRNPAWDQWSVVYWSTIEINVGLICTCLPTLRLIFLRVRSKFEPEADSTQLYAVQTSEESNISEMATLENRYVTSETESREEYVSGKVTMCSAIRLPERH